MKGKVWLRYDRAFRQAAASQPTLRWDQREPDVWLASITEDGQVQGEGSEPSPVGSAEIQPLRRRRQAMSDVADRVCFKWNRGDCQGRSCRYAPKCLVCSSVSHPARICPILFLQRLRRQASPGAQVGERSLKDTASLG